MQRFHATALPRPIGYPPLPNGRFFTWPTGQDRSRHDFFRRPKGRRYTMRSRPWLRRNAAWLWPASWHLHGRMFPHHNLDNGKYRDAGGFPAFDSR